MANGVSVDGYFDNFSLVAVPFAPKASDIVLYELITPNGDGYNDTFKIQNVDLVPLNQLKIFNRSGDCVAAIENFRNGAWTGESLANSTYYYIFTTANFELKGSLVVQRQ